MQDFITNAINALYQPRTGGAPGLEGNLLDSCRYKELSGDLFDWYGFSDQKQYRSSLSFALIGLADSKGRHDAEACALDVLRNLYLTHKSIIRVSEATHPDHLEGLNALVSLPPVDMNLLVNKWLQPDVTPGNNRVLVYKDKQIYMGTPSATDALGLEWTSLVKSEEAESLLGQFQQITAALQRIESLLYVPPELNSEGFPGPVVGWGGH